MSTQQQQGPQQGQQQETAQSLAEGLLRGPVTIGKRGVEINDTHDAWRFANIAFTSGLAPKGFKNVASVMIAVMMGAELGMTPMASIQNIAVINNRPSLWGDVMLALCRQSGKFDEEVWRESYDEKQDGGTCFCTCRRKPDGKSITSRFSMVDADRAGLLSKDNWKYYEKRMLMFRARSWALRDAFGDVLLGLRSAEEERDIPADEPAEEPVSSLGELTAKLSNATVYDSSVPSTAAAAANVVAITPKPEPAEDPLADHGVRTSPRKPEPEEAEAIAEPEPPYNPPTETEVEASRPVRLDTKEESSFAQPAMSGGEISNAERRCEEDRHFREFSQALADAESASEVADLGKKLDEFHEASLLAGLDYLSLKKDIDAVKTRMSQ